MSIQMQTGAHASKLKRLTRMMARWRIFGRSPAHDDAAVSVGMHAALIEERRAIDPAEHAAPAREREVNRHAGLINGILTASSAALFELERPYEMGSMLRWHQGSGDGLAAVMGRRAPASLDELCTLMDPRDRRALADMLRSCLGATSRVEVVARRLSFSIGPEKTLPIRVRLCVLRDEAGAIESCVALVEDDSGPALLEREFEQVKARFDCGRDLIEDGLWDTEMIQTRADDGRQHYWWSPQFKRLLGFGEYQDEFRPNLESWAGRLHPQDRDHVFAAFAAHLQDATNRTPYDVEYRIRKRDDSYTWLRARCTTQRFEDGTPRRVVGSVSDISHRKREEDHRVAHQERAAATDQHVRDIGAVSQVIQRLTQQSMLLGINASVEAAHVGEKGRGFAVIAGEMRDLSERISRAAVEIARLQSQIADKR